MQTLKGFTREYLAALFDYCAETGDLRRKLTTHYLALEGDMVSCEHNAGYIHVQIDGVRLLARRLAYFIHTGETPEEIDHKDCDRKNNRFNNLRAATSSLNKYNVPLKRNNTSGFKGVHYDKSRKKFAAQLMLGGRSVRIGRYNNAEDAARAYDKAAIEGVGEFALTNAKMGLV